MTQSESQPGLHERILAGEHQALVELIRGHFAHAWAIASRILEGVGDDADVDEVASDVFTYVWAQIHTYDETRIGGDFTRWVNQVAKWRSLAARRRLLREARHRAEMPDVDQTDLSSPESDLFDRLETAERQERLNAALATLSQDDRVLVTLYYGEGVPLHEIAVQLGIAPSAARQRLHRARGRLQKAGAIEILVGVAS